MKRLTELAIEIIEAKTSCTINESENYYSIYVDNRYCQDFEFEIEKGENEVEEIIDYCNNFDPEDEFKCWYGANKGEPQSPQALLDNCNEIAEHLEELADLLRDFDFETAEKLQEENQSLTNDEICEIVEQGYEEVCAIYKDKDQMAYEEAQSLLGINETTMNFVKNEINGWFNMSKKQEELTNYIEQHIL